ncbi:TrmH family RNA methyltransferase [Patescibacteria group bacterium]|nr:TrmH family RNA methyltransferase [Patescibacteria group bacterium]
MNMFYVICHNIRSRENIGSIFRTADAFGLNKIFLTGYTPVPPHEKISKTALGAEQFVLWDKMFSVSRLITRLKKEKFEMVALEQSQKSLDVARYRPSKNIALILGNEVNGIPPAILKKCDRIVEIPMQGKKESLNVAVAFGVAAYAISQKQQKL